MQKSQTCQTNGATTIVLANIKKIPLQHHDGRVFGGAKALPVGWSDL